MGVENVDEFPSLGYWIRRRRKSLDLTQTDLARLVFCSLSMIKKIELDERRPSRLMAERLAECLQLRSPDRETFLAVANAELTYDRLSGTSSVSISTPRLSNISSYLPLTPFIGYKAELAEISNLIVQRKTRLISLVGPGGIGKTRLAIQVASGQIHNFSGGVFFIPFAQIENAGYIPTAIIDELMLPLHGILDLRAYLLEYLQDKAMLLMLDNMEHVLDGADLIVDILHASPSSVLVTTSRTPLNLSMERVFEVKGMPIRSAAGVENPETYDAVQLFVQYARQVGYGAELTREDLVTIINICNLVEGMPLAIELAASWARVHSLVVIKSGIQDSLDFLTSKMRDIQERHRSMRAAFEFSWRLLSEEEQRVFSTLSIFRGSFHLQAIQAITGADRATVESLISQSMLRRSGSDSYDMHELLRRYSELKLSDPAQLIQLRKAYLAYYLQLAENSLSRSAAGYRNFNHVALEKEIDNFRAALQMTVENRALETGFRLAIALSPFWRDYGYLPEGMSWLSRLLELDDGQFPALRARALIQSANRALEMGYFEQAILLSKESLALCEQLKDKGGLGLSLMNIGIARYLAGEFDRGIKLLQRSLKIFQETGDEEHQLQATLRIADINQRRGLLDQASEEWQDALSIASRLNHKLEIGFSLGGLGDLRRLQGKYHEAFTLYKKALRIHWEENQRLDLPYVMEAMALNYASLGSYSQAVILLGAAENLRDETHSPLPPSYRKAYAPVIEETREKLGELAFVKIWQDGRNAPLEQVIDNSINPPNEPANAI